MQTQQVKAYIQHGSATSRPMHTEEVAHNISAAPATGPKTGRKVATEHRVHFNGRWRRVYTDTVFKTTYILDTDNSRLTVSFY